MRTADAAWVERPFEDWARCLTGLSGELQEGSGNALAVGMAETLSIRDALIVSLVAGGEAMGTTAMIEFASRPHDPKNVNLMCRLLAGAFEDEHALPDMARSRLGIHALEPMLRLRPERFRVQPAAVIAYVSWWAADARSASYALQALAIDGNCTLAAIVLSALEHGIRPAWCRNHVDSRGSDPG